jgi:hypothetical protein
MSRTEAGAGLLCIVVALGLAPGCECESRHHFSSPASVSASSTPPASAPADAAPGPEQTSSAWRPRAYAAGDEPPERVAEPSTLAALDGAEAGGSVVGPFIIDALADVAAAGPATATEQGVAMVNRDNQLHLARLTSALGTGPLPRETPIAGLSESAGPFPLGKGPAVRRGIAFWVSRGQLLAQSLSAAGSDTPPRTLSEDARVGTRVAVPVGPASALESLPQQAAYIARSKEPDAPLTAKLWVAGSPEPLALTDDMASAHSVALVATEQGVAAIFLEARTGMSSIHLRRVRFSKSLPPSLDEDRVVWVGGPGRPSTELLALSADAASVTGLMTLERDMLHFGLLGLHIPLATNAMPPDPDWLLYANGIEPAPFAGANVCGRPVVALARPSSAVPHAPQELILVELGREAARSGTLLGRSREFFDISLVALGNGALLSYVADHRTWARTLRCSGR